LKLDQSLQWAAFQRLVKLLESRGNDVLVLVGPFNEHMMAEENRPRFRRLRDGIADWLAKNRVPHIVPATLPARSMRRKSSAHGRVPAPGRRALE